MAGHARTGDAIGDASPGDHAHAADPVDPAIASPPTGRDSAPDSAPSLAARTVDASNDHQPPGGSSRRLPAGAEPARGGRARWRGLPLRVLHRIGRAFEAGLPHTFQGRLSLAFVGVVVLTLLLVGALILNRLDDYFMQQERQNLDARAIAVANVVSILASEASDDGVVVTPDDRLNATVRASFTRSTALANIANRVALANVSIRFGQVSVTGTGRRFIPVADAPFKAVLTATPTANQARDSIATPPRVFENTDNPLLPWALEVTLSDPYTSRASTISAVAGLLAAVAIIALLFAIIVASLLTRRFTTPLRRLEEASVSLAEGDLTQRVPPEVAAAGGVEVAALARQFNAMADRLEESMQIIRHDRDTSREFLADVSHELRTPLAALRTFNELLQDHAGGDPEARAEFLDASAQQIGRLDWLAQNLLDLSKLDSGLLQLDLRPEDLRATIESATEQASAAASKRGVELHVSLPDRPLRIRHDPQRIGQVVSNLVGNALKFTPRGGSVRVALEALPEGARIVVSDTGIGIDAAELPHIFERFYRGSSASEARSSGSGLGLAIVRSVIDMHNGRISVESRPGQGSTFSVELPRDPREVERPAIPGVVDT